MKQEEEEVCFRFKSTEGMNLMFQCFSWMLRMFPENFYEVMTQFL